MRTLQDSFDEDGEFVKVKVGKRISRNARLALMWSILAMSNSSPSLLAGGLLSIVILLVLTVIRILGKWI